jgi:IS5 family transposase
MGHPPSIGVETMLRIYLVQQRFNLSDRADEDALYDSKAIRRFAGVELGEGAVPDERTILRFRHLPEQHQLTETLFAAVRELPGERLLPLRMGRIVDATIIAALSSSKNATGNAIPRCGKPRRAPCGTSG